MSLKEQIEKIIHKDIETKIMALSAKCPTCKESLGIQAFDIWLAEDVKKLAQAIADRIEIDKKKLLDEMSWPCEDCTNPTPCEECEIFHHKKYAKNWIKENSDIIRIRGEK
jgi:hypothetical protein